MKRRLFLTNLAAAGIAAVGTPVLADQPRFFSRGGAAISGYDPVAYFTEGKPVPGRREFAVMWKGAIWMFASAENRSLFEMNPYGYAPQYGGYCAYAVSRGYTSKTEPDAWRIVDGKLYLNFSKPVRAIWAQDIPGNITKANANWPAVLRQ